MPTNTFAFKQFVIHQDRCAMKVGTDAVLLGAWVRLPNQPVSDLVRPDSMQPNLVQPDLAQSGHPGDDAAPTSSYPQFPFTVLDMGSGTGILALMAAQRGARHVVGVEIDAEAVGQARENVQRSPYANVVDIVQADLCTWHSDQRFDIILSNPPFFREDTLSPSAARATARHAAALSFEQLVACACRHLASDGQFSVVLPAKEMAHFTGICTLNDLSLVRCTLVSTRQGQPPKRVLLTFTNHPCPDRPQRDMLTLTDAEGQRSSAYASLTADFYLR